MNFNLFLARTKLPKPNPVHSQLTDWFDSHEVGVIKISPLRLSMPPKELRARKLYQTHVERLVKSYCSVRSINKNICIALMDDELYNGWLDAKRKGEIWSMEQWQDLLSPADSQYELYVIAGAHSTTAYQQVLQSLSPEEQKDERCSNLPVTLLLCQQNDDDMKTLKLLGSRDNWIGGIRRKGTFTETLQLLMDHCDEYIDKNLPIPVSKICEEVGTVLGIGKFTLHNYYNFFQADREMFEMLLACMEPPDGKKPLFTGPNQMKELQLVNIATRKQLLSAYLSGSGSVPSLWELKHQCFTLRGLSDTRYFVKQKMIDALIQAKTKTAKECDAMFWKDFVPLFPMATDTQWIERVAQLRAYRPVKERFPEHFVQECQKRIVLDLDKAKVLTL